MFTDKNADLPAPWQWPGLWALNLPVLVVVWQILFAQAFHVWLSPYHLFTTAALTWAFVACERWIYFFRLRKDVAEHLLSAQKLTEQRSAIVRICLLIVFGLILLAVFRGNTREMAGLLIWTSVGGSYLLAMRHAPTETSEFFPREVALAAYLTGPAVLFVWANGSFPPLHLLLPSLLFLLLFFYYFCLVGIWAKPLLPSDASGPLFEGPLAPLYRVVPILLIVAAIFPVMLSLKTGMSSLLLSIGVSGLILLFLDLGHQSLGKFASRLLADVAMLSPAIPLLIALYP